MRWSDGAVVLWLLAATGCRGLLGLDGEVAVVDAQLQDAAADALLDAAPEYGCFGHDARWRLCPLAVNERTNLSGMLDTGTSPECESVPSWDDSQPPACIIVARHIAIDSDFRAVGVRPLVLLGTESVAINALLDVASGVVVAGAGGDPAVCPAGTQPGAAANGSGGGAGGTFYQIVGGTGGSGDQGATAGGLAGPVGDPSTLRGGCRGQEGGHPITRTRSGRGGGAVYVVSGGEITGSGVINASGGGGLGASQERAGGAGGGSGGMIGLVAPVISPQLRRMVHGGGGGGGGGATNNPGGQGGQANPTNPTMAPVGGNGPARGGNGGVYQGPPPEAGTNGPASIGGGGGGGGAGAVFLATPL